MLTRRLFAGVQFRVYQSSREALLQCQYAQSAGITGNPNTDIGKSRKIKFKCNLGYIVRPYI